MESRPRFVSAAIRHVPQRGLWTPADLSSASTRTTHLAELGRPPGSVGTRLHYPAGLRPQPAHTHPWGTQAWNMAMWWTLGQVVQVPCWMNLQWVLRKLVRVNRASQIHFRAESGRKSLYCAMKSHLAMFKLNSCFFFTVLQKTSCKMLPRCTAKSKCLHLSGQGDWRRHTEAVLWEVSNAAAPGRPAVFSHSIRCSWELIKDALVCSSPPRPLGLAVWNPPLQQASLVKLLQTHLGTRAWGHVDDRTPCMGNVSPCEPRRVLVSGSQRQPGLVPKLISRAKEEDPVCFAKLRQGWRQWASCSSLLNPCKLAINMPPRHGTTAYDRAGTDCNWAQGGASWAWSLYLRPCSHLCFCSFYRKWWLSYIVILIKIKL